MRAGRLDRKISILRAGYAQDGAGEPIRTWTPIIVRRSASMVPIRGDERFSGDQYVAREQVEFRIRWSQDVADLSPLDRIVEPALNDAAPDPEITDRRQYDIMAVHEIGRREGLQVLAARRVDELDTDWGELDPLIEIQPGTGNLIVTGYPPIVQVLDEAIVATPGTGLLTVTGFAPTIELPWPDLEVVPGTGLLTLTGFAPTIELPWADIEVVPGTGALVVTGFAPTVQVVEADVFEAIPGTGELTVQGFAPDVAIIEPDLVAQPGTGELTLTGYPPTISIVYPDIEVVPGTGELTLTGFAPTTAIIYPDIVVTPATGALTVTGYAPTVEVEDSVPDLTANLISFWELDEASGARADSHGSYDLTDVNTVGQNTGKVGNAAEMVSANGERLTHADNADLGYSGDFSVATWLYFNSFTNSYIISKDAATFANIEWRIQQVNSGGSKLNFEVATGNSATGALHSTALSTGTWYFVVATYAASTRDMTLSLNAGTRAINTHSGDLARKTSAEFVLGGRTGISGLNGRIDQTGFWKRALTTDEEAWLYNSGAGRSYAEIAATGA